MKHLVLFIALITFSANTFSLLKPVGSRQTPDKKCANGKWSIKCRGSAYTPIPQTPVEPVTKSIEFSWVPSTLREDGSLIESIDQYRIYTTNNNWQSRQLVVDVLSPTTTYTLVGLSSGVYEYAISTVESGLEGAMSLSISISSN